MSKNSEPQSPKGALAASDTDDLPEQLRIRRAKRASIIERGLEPYPVSVPRTKTLKELRDAHKDLAIDVTTGITESVTGRIFLNEIPENYVSQRFAKVRH
jgi:Lysyl-tRNA synthetase (class II)